MTNVDPNGYYRQDGHCQPCGTTLPFALYAVIGTIAFVAMALAAEKWLVRVTDVAQLLAPFFILLTFFQTLSLMLKFTLHWPESLKKLIRLLSIINFNIELARPECSIEWTAHTRMNVILLVPTIAVMLIACFAGTKIMLQHQGTHQVMYKCEAIAVAMMMICSSFYLKGIFGGIDCSVDDTNGRYYLDISPGIECSNDSDEYSSIKTKSYVGLAMWLCLMSLMAFTFLREGILALITVDPCD